MTCRKLIDLLSQYHDGELALRQRIWANEHLARCEKCTGYLRGYEQTIVLIKQSVESSDGQEKMKFPEDLVVRILAGVRKN